MELSNKITWYLEGPDVLNENHPYRKVLEEYQKLLQDNSLEDRIVPWSVGEKIQNFVDELKRDPSSEKSRSLFDEIQQEIQRVSEQHFELLKDSNTGDVVKKLEAILIFLEKEKQKEENIGRQQEIDSTISQINELKNFIETENTNPQKPRESFESFINEVEWIYSQAISQTSSVEARNILIQQLIQIERLKQQYNDEKSVFLQESQDQAEEAKQSLIYEPVKLFWEDVFNIWGNYLWVVGENTPNIKIAFDQIQELWSMSHEEILELSKSIYLPKTDVITGYFATSWTKEYSQIQEDLKFMVQHNHEFVKRLKETYPEIENASWPEIQNFLIEKFETDLTIGLWNSIKEVFNQLKQQVWDWGDTIIITAGEEKKIISFDGDTKARDTSLAAMMIFLSRLNSEDINGVAEFLWWSTATSIWEVWSMNILDPKNPWLITLLSTTALSAWAYSVLNYSGVGFRYRNPIQKKYTSWRHHYENGTLSSSEWQIAEKDVKDAGIDVEHMKLREDLIRYYIEQARAEWNTSLEKTLKKFKNKYIFYKSDKYFHNMLEQTVGRESGKIGRGIKLFSRIAYVNSQTRFIINEPRRWLWIPTITKDAKVFSPQTWFEGAKERHKRLLENRFLQEFDRSPFISNRASKIMQELVSKSKTDILSPLDSNDIEKYLRNINSILSDINKTGIADSVLLGLSGAIESHTESTVWDTNLSQKEKFEKITLAMEQKKWEMENLKGILERLPKWDEYDSLKQSVLSKVNEGIGKDDNGQAIEKIKVNIDNIVHAAEATEGFDPSIKDALKEKLNTIISEGRDYSDRISRLEIQLKDIHVLFTPEYRDISGNIFENERLNTDFLDDFRALQKELEDGDLSLNEKKELKDEFISKYTIIPENTETRSWTTQESESHTWNSSNWDDIIQEESWTWDTGESPIDRYGAIDAEWEVVTDEPPIHLEGPETIEKNKENAIDIFERFVLQIEDEQLGKKVSGKMISSTKSWILDGSIPVDDIESFTNGLKSQANKVFWLTIDNIKTRVELMQSYLDKNRSGLSPDEIWAIEKAIRGEDIDIKNYTRTKWIKYIRQAVRW